MHTFVVSRSSLEGRTGRGVRVAVVDSGIHDTHPHVQGISGGASFGLAGEASGDLVDRLGHGTAVAAAIRDHAPDAELLAVKVFDRTLATSGQALVAAILWSACEHASLINLSLGTTNADHEAALAAAVRDASIHGSIVVAAAPQEGQRWLPGALEGVIGVELDWECERDRCEVSLLPDGNLRVRASGYPRPIPGVPASRNLRGPSFGVANACGLLALILEDLGARSIEAVASRLLAHKQSRS
jgi:subtilisin family serine protease